MLNELKNAKKAIVNILEYPSYNNYIVEQAMLCDEFITSAIVKQKAIEKANSEIEKIVKSSTIGLSRIEAIEQEIGISEHVKPNIR